MGLDQQNAIDERWETQLEPKKLMGKQKCSQQDEFSTTPATEATTIDYL
jgi:hypothetical protein